LDKIVIVFLDSEVYRAICFIKESNMKQNAKGGVRKNLLLQRENIFHAN